MAISAQADYCGVYALKPMHQLQEEMSEFGSLDEGKFKPISEVGISSISLTVRKQSADFSPSPGTLLSG